MKEKIKDFLKKVVLILCLFIVYQLVVEKIFEVRSDDGAFIYAIAATILTIYLYGNRRNK